MTSCTRCGAPARWRSGDDALCASHGAEEAARGRLVTLEPPADLVDRLEDAGGGLALEAAGEIRRLRDRLAVWEGCGARGTCERA